MATRVNVTPFFTPTQISGCLMWLDAADRSSMTFAGTNILSIQDKATSARRFTPVTGNFTYVIDQNRQVINIPNTTYMSTTTAISVTANTSWVFVVTKLATTNDAYLLEFMPNNRAFRYGYSGRYIGGPSATGDTNDLLTPNQSYMNGSFNTLITYTNYHQINGPIQTTQTTTSINLSSSYLNRYYIGTLAEVLVYSGPITNAQRQLIEGYLAWKWGLQADLPATHPYKSSPIPPLLSPSTSLPVSLRQPSFVNWSPTLLSNCQLWFDAADATTVSLSGSLVTQWRDKSPNAYSVSQATNSARPTYTSGLQNGLAGIQFSQSTWLLTQGSLIPNFSAGAATSVFIAARNASTNTGWNLLNTMWFDGTGTTRYHFSFNQGSTTGTTLFANGGLVGQVTSNATPVNSNAILGFTASASSASIHTNGSSNAYGGVTLPSASNTTSFLFGDNRNSASFGANIAIFEMVGFNRQITATERQLIEGYYAWKWGLQANLPATHPYKTLAPSITAAPIAPLARATSRLWIPTQISGCALWMDVADSSTLTTSGTTVTQWRDKIAGVLGTPFRGASAVAMTLVGKSIFINNNGSTYNSSTFTCFQFNSNPITAAQTTLFAVFRLTATTNLDALVEITNGAGDQFRVFGQSQVFEIGSGYNRSVSMSAFSTNTLLTSWVSQNPSSQIFLNGSLYAQNTTSANLGSPSTGALFIGGGKSDNRWFSGFVSEVLWYNAVLSEPQRQQVEGYLAWKWGLQGSLPATHPFKNWPPSP